MRVYVELARRGYRRYAAYPTATWAGVFTNTVFGFMRAYILLTLFEHRDVIGGYDATKTVTYTWLTQGLIATVFIWGWHDLALRIRSGDIAIDLARPVDPQFAGLAFDLGRAVYHGLFRAVPPIIVGAIVFELTAPRDPLVWLGFACSVVLAVAVSFAFRFLYNLAAFWLLDYRGVSILAMVSANLFSGFVVPIPFFPAWLSTIAYATPFPAMIQMPIDVFVGATTGADIALTLVIQLAWLGGLLAIGRGVFVLGTRRVVVQGG